jgi:hypothetical protein
MRAGIPPLGEPLPVPVETICKNLLGPVHARLDELCKHLETLARVHAGPSIRGP